MYRVISTALKTVEDEVLGLIVIDVIYLYNIINRLCYCSKKFPRRESHSLEPEGTGFTDPPAYFNGLLRIKMEDPRVELGLKDFQSPARTGYTNLPNQDI